MGVSREEKKRREEEAMVHVQSLIPDSMAGVRVREMWEEYEAAETVEAKLVKVCVCARVLKACLGL